MKININCTRDIIDIFVNFAFNYYYWTMVSDNRTSNRECNCNCNSRVKLEPNLSQRLLLLNWYYLNLLFEALYTYVHTHIYISFPKDRTKARFTGRTILARSVISRNGSSGENNRWKLARHFVSRLNTIYVETAIGVSASWIARQRGRSWATLCREGI